MQKITPFLWFDRNAEEAMHFYTSLFPDSKIINIQRYPDGPLEGPMKGFEGQVLTGTFEMLGQQFMCLDGGPVFKPTAAVSFLVLCEDQAEIDRYWTALSVDPAFEQCGWLKDKYGFSWQIVPKGMDEMLNNPDKAKAARAMAAMMEMKKIDIAKLKEAAV